MYERLIKDVSTSSCVLSAKNMQSGSNKPVVSSLAHGFPVFQFLSELHAYLPKALPIPTYILHLMEHWSKHLVVVQLHCPFCSKLEDIQDLLDNHVPHRHRNDIEPKDSQMSLLHKKLVKVETMQKFYLKVPDLRSMYQQIHRAMKCALLLQDSLPHHIFQVEMCKVYYFSSSHQSQS